MLIKAEKIYQGERCAMTDDHKVLIPDFAVEKRTKALNTGVWGLFCFLSSLQTAYVIQPDKIIVGKITRK